MWHHPAWRPGPPTPIRRIAMKSIRVLFSAPYGCGPDQAGFSVVKQMASVPRIGDEVTFDDPDGEEYLYRVHVVTWCPDSVEYDAYVILRD